MTAAKLPMMALMATALSIGCRDAYIADQIEALGDEAPGFEPSEIHRPGSPCVLCHSKNGGGDAPEMSVAGTLFYELEGAPPIPAEGYVVRLLDSEGEVFERTSNRCGNFFFPKEEADPAFPLKVTIFAPDPNDPQKLLANERMTSRIGRDGSCAACHKHPKSVFSPGVVTVTPPEGVIPAAATQCPPNNFAPQLNIEVVPAQ